MVLARTLMFCSQHLKCSTVIKFCNSVKNAYILLSILDTLSQLFRIKSVSVISLCDETVVRLPVHLTGLLQIMAREMFRNINCYSLLTHYSKDRSNWIKAILEGEKLICIQLLHSTVYWFTSFTFYFYLFFSPFFFSLPCWLVYNTKFLFSRS